MIYKELSIGDWFTVKNSPYLNEDDILIKTERYAYLILSKMNQDDAGYSIRIGDNVEVNFISELPIKNLPVHQYIPAIYNIGTEIRHGDLIQLYEDDIMYLIIAISEENSGIVCYSSNNSILDMEGCLFDLTYFKDSGTIKHYTKNLLYKEKNGIEEL